MTLADIAPANAAANTMSKTELHYRAECDRIDERAAWDKGGPGAVC